MKVALSLHDEPTKIRPASGYLDVYEALEHHLMVRFRHIRIGKSGRFRVHLPPARWVVIAWDPDLRPIGQLPPDRWLETVTVRPHRLTRLHILFDVLIP